LNEAEVGLHKFFVPRADSAVTFEAAKEVFDVVAASATAAVKERASLTIAPGRNVQASALLT